MRGRAADVKDISGADCARSVRRRRSGNPYGRAGDYSGR